MKSGPRKKSFQQCEELQQNAIFLNRKPKHSEKNSLKIITRKDYQKREVINLCKDNLKQLNDTLLSDDEKYSSNTSNKPQTIVLSSNTESAEEEFDNEKKTCTNNAFAKIIKDFDLDDQLYAGNIVTNMHSSQKSKSVTGKAKSAFESQSDFIGIPQKTSAGEFIPLENSEGKFTMVRESIDFPWLTEKSKKERGMLKLHYEILEFYEFIRPTSEEDLLRERTMKSVKDLIKTHFPDLKVKKFGSFPNKIHLPDSDVDIVVLSDKDQNVDQTKILKKITQKLIDNDMVDFIRIIEARVPIIRGTLKNTKINMDISANRKNGYEAKKVIKKVLEDFPHIRPLMYVLKYFLRQRKLNESYTGGISSFLLFNLLFAYIQYATKENDPNMKTIGHLLTGFLQFYSFVFNFEEVGISIRHGGFFYKKSTR